jgi:gephyrin
MPGTFPVVGEVKAGRVADFEVKPGTVARITTGAPVPAGADAVIKVEVTELLAERDAEGRQLVKFNVGTAPGRCIRPVGSDIQPDQTVVTFVRSCTTDLTYLAFLIY